jgi:peptidoglycan/xylan/chitin deacetylase (PgdA/CDA1 family)
VQTFPIVIPGDPLLAQVSVSLIFDDAYIDFYECVFPLLKQYQIKALLAVPVSYISEKVEKPMRERILQTYCAGTDKSSEEVNAAFCSWVELKEMVDSGHVVIASHTQSHCSVPALKMLSDKFLEVVDSKKILEQRLGVTVEHFVYPYGDWCRASHQFIAQYYQYIHRIGGALNVAEQLFSKKLLYRIDAGDLFMNYQPIHAKQLGIWWCKALWNRIRFK